MLVLDMPPPPQAPSMMSAANATNFAFMFHPPVTRPMRTADEKSTLRILEEGIGPVHSVGTSRRFLPFACPIPSRSEKHTSELQSHNDPVCRLIFLNYTATTDIYLLPPPDALQISQHDERSQRDQLCFHVPPSCNATDANGR